MINGVRRQMAAWWGTAGVVGTMVVGGLLAGAAPVAAADGEGNSRPPVGFTAQVAADGELLSGSHVVSSQRVGEGAYVVTFDRSVRACAYIGTITDTWAQVALVQTANQEGDDASVAVQTRTLSTLPRDFGFTVEARCSAEQGAYAVIEADGAIDRAAKIDSVDRVRDGWYRVRFTRKVNECATTATIGSTGSTALTTTNLVSAVGGRHKRDVLVSTTSENGTFVDRPFHLAVTCGGSTERPWGFLTEVGTPIHGPNVTRVEEIAEGLQEVTLRTSGDACTYTATPGSEPATFAHTAGSVDVSLVRASGTEIVLQVHTRNTFQAGVPMAVSLVLVC